MKKIVIVTAVLTTTLVYDAHAKDSCAPESVDTVVDIVAVGKKGDEQILELNGEQTRVLSELVQSEVRGKQDVFVNATKQQKKEIKKTARLKQAEKRAAELSAANKSWFKPKTRVA